MSPPTTAWPPAAATLYSGAAMLRSLVADDHDAPRFVERRIERVFGADV